MKCENYLCIYQKDNKCLLDKIQIDITGSCSECIYPNIPENTLEAEKEKLRNHLEK